MRNMLIAAGLFLFMAPLSMMAQSPSDVEVSDIRFKSNVYRAEPYFSDASASNAFPSRWSRWYVGELSANIQNRGTKPIKSVKWEYLVFRDAQQTDLAGVYNFQSKKKVLSGESTRFKKIAYDLQNTPYAKGRVIRIEYADGTVWQGTPTKK